MLKYAIEPGEQDLTVIEASESSNPADRSLLDLRIGSKGSETIHHIDVIVPVPLDTAQDGTLPAIPQVLTRHPERVTPVSGFAGAWDFRYVGTTTADGATFSEAVFRAQPLLRGTATVATVGDGAGNTPAPGLTLSGLEVADQAGDVDITIREFSETDSTDQKLKLAKIFPSLRIERFYATPTSVTPGSTLPSVG